MKKMTTGITALIIGLVAVSGTAFAFWNESSSERGLGTFAPIIGSENTEAIENAIEANDYDAWKEAMIETLTEERFNELVEMNKKMTEMNKNREALNTALENGDYESWKTAMENLENPRITELITEENFDIYVKLHEAQISGDFETAKQLSEELGIENYGGGRGSGIGGRMRFFGGEMGDLIPLQGG
jgi:hypothetical protein